ncbi:MAG: DNA translocase FtsK 4TM domain-containing protein, partial [Solirubrobacterales bacterium]
MNTRRRAPAPRSRRKLASRARRDPRRELRELADGLEQRHYDVIGLALIAAGVFLAFVLYLGWDGGRVGGWLATALENAAGRVAYVVPIALAAWGGALIARPLLRAPTALNAGGILILAALLLGFAAETAGLGPERPNRHEFFEQRFMVEHGGAVGEALYWASTTLFQRLGAHILAVLMLVSGTLLVTGTTVAGLLGATGRAVRKTGTGTREVARTVRTQRQDAADPWGPPGEEIAVTRADPTEPITSELDDEAETVAVSEAEGWAEPERDVDGVAYEQGGSRPVTDPADAGDEADPAAGGGLTPMGNKRHKEGITASDEIAYRPPPAKALERGKA